MIQAYIGKLILALLELLVYWLQQAYDIVVSNVHFSSESAFASTVLVFVLCFASGFLLTDVVLLYASMQ